MYFSALQKYILLQCHERRRRKCDREIFLQFYNKNKIKKNRKDIVNIITKSIERLIDRELLIGYGIRTSHKWFIKEIKLTPKGRRRAKKLLGEQQKLPLKDITPISYE